MRNNGTLGALTFLTLTTFFTTLRPPPELPPEGSLAMS